MKSVYSDAIVEKVAKNGGIFLVEIDGETVFSKQSLNPPRFPEAGEINELIKKFKKF
ncbi:hypothetical protein F1B92_05110 [Campylobacter sp. FMV-PI01]|uniref:Rdx family protein n=1 Tax=Campylobacter portucalensis TaxID=2608384 RepID=A0A6L5WLG6_9BACT|nr:hypothetical protein [Campylobacter portucalensis]